MYEVFYGLKEKPFSMLPDPGFLFLSKKHQAALTLLEYGLLNHVGFCVISGEAGAGKTTILRALLDRVDSSVTVGLITNTHQSFGGLLDWILSVFDLHKPNLTHVEMHQIFMEYLIEEYANNRSVLLIVDEAQNMKAEALEELRMLSNVNSEKDQLLQVVLAGQPALKETLRKPELMQFAQRIAVDFHLDPLSLKETCGYIQHRLVTAGAQKDIFTPAACERIHTYSGGTPRLINLLCETVMVYGFADDVEVIDVDLVDEMVQERMKDSVVPILNRDIAKNKTAGESELDIEDFPWIKPEGGTKGLKPDETEAVKPKVSAVSSVDVEAKKTDVKPVLKEKDSDVIPSSEKTDNDMQAPEAGVAKEAVEDGKREAIGEKKTASVSPQAKSQEAVSSKTFSEAHRSIFSEENADVEKSEKRGKVIKYGAILGVLILLIFVAAFLFAKQKESNMAVLKDEAVQMQKQREQEAAELEKLQSQAEALKKERDAAIRKVEEEKKAKEAAVKLAAEKALLEEQKMKERRALDEKKRKAEAADRKRRVQQAEARAKREAERRAAVYEEERLQMQARLDEEIRLKKRQEEELRLERERQELQRQQAIKEAEAAAARSAAAKRSVIKKPDNTDICSGPAARFKSTCR